MSPDKVPVKWHDTEITPVAIVRVETKMAETLLWSKVAGDWDIRTAVWL